MKFIFDRDTWQEIYGSIRKNKLRTVITIIGVLWGIFLLIALLGAARGMENSFNRQFGDFATNSVFVWGRSTSKAFHGFQKGKRVRLNITDTDVIKNEIKDIEFVVPRNNNSGNVIRKFKSASFSVSGDYPILDKVQKKKLLYGRFINDTDIEEKRKVCVISEQVYEQLFEKNEIPISEFIKINNINFQVVGVYKPGVINFGDDIHIPFSTFQQIYNQGNKIGWMMVTGKPDSDIVKIESDIKLILSRLHDLHPEDERAIGSFNLGERFEQMTGFLKGMQFLTWFVGISTLLAGIFAIGNILLITVKERTKEIGIRRALGAKPVEIKQQIVLESVFLTMIAGVLGVIFGGGVLMLLDRLFGQGDDASLVNPTVSIPIIIISVLLLITLGTLIGLIPAHIATKIKPIEALREE